MKPYPLLVAALLAACGAPTPDNAATPATAAEAGSTANYAQEVLALSDKERDAVLFRAIRDAGIGCQGVTGSERAAGDAAHPQWRAQCTDGSYHLVSIDPAGTALVVSQADR